MPEPTILDIANTDIGTIYLSKREVSGLPRAVYEILLGDDVLMTSLAPVSERRLSTSALNMHAGKELHVLVGGLGLGYTAHAALADPRVVSVRVVEKMDFVIDWMNAGLLPLSEHFASNARIEIVKGDVYAELLGPHAKRYDLILIDVDHAPDDPLSEQSLPFYTEAGQRTVAQHLRPGGVLGVWSAVQDANFSAALSLVYASSHTEDVFWQDIEFPEADYQNVLFLAQSA